MLDRVQGSLSPVLVLLFAFIGACSNGDDAPADAGLTLAITDAASDDLSSFVVEVESVQLTKAGGATVGALTSPTSVDLVTLEEVSQVLGVLNVPAGLYTAATVTLDFDAAVAYVLGGTSPATILDGDGNPLFGSVSLPILVASPVDAVVGEHRVLELDFDLNQSVRVDVGANTVYVEPALVLRVDPSDPKDLFAGGVIESVEAAAGSLAVELQTLGGVRLGDVTVLVDDATLYQLDGAPSQGGAGLLALESDFVGTWVQCYGFVDPAGARLCATLVEAGAGTYNGGTDILEGLITTRVGGAGADPILTVLGHSNSADHSSFYFNTEFTVSASQSGSTVVRRGDGTLYDADSLNVGQRVRVFGTLSGFTLNAGIPGTVIRLQPTRVLGFANAAPASGQLELDLVRVDLRDESEFTWADSGTSAPDPNAFTATVGSLGDGLGITAGTAVEVLGYFAPVDDPGDDFLGSALVNRDQAPSLLALGDRAGGLLVESTVTTSELAFDLTGSPGLLEFAVLDRGFVGVEDLPTQFSIAPALPLGIYLISDRTSGALSLQLDFAPFATALDASLAQGATIYNVTAIGTYVDADQRLDAFLIIAVIE